MNVTIGSFQTIPAQAIAAFGQDQDFACVRSTIDTMCRLVGISSTMDESMPIGTW